MKERRRNWAEESGFWRRKQALATAMALANRALHRTHSQRRILRKEEDDGDDDY